ncbi:unnamed protein product [Dicrocoelium dendriticum]|nr:unnamed protein product [Dicrocoelium dendriticum]
MRGSHISCTHFCQTSMSLGGADRTAGGGGEGGAGRPDNHSAYHLVNVSPVKTIFVPPRFSIFRLLSSLRTHPLSPPTYLTVLTSTKLSSIS